MRMGRARGSGSVGEGVMILAGRSVFASAIAEKVDTIRLARTLRKKLDDLVRMLYSIAMHTRAIVDGDDVLSGQATHVHKNGTGW